MSLTLIEEPALASAPVPTIRSLLTSLVGGGPEGGVTVGGLESGPVLGVVGAAAAPLVASFSAALFSSPTPMLLPLELLEPQPAMRIATASAARPRMARPSMARERAV